VETLTTATTKSTPTYGYEPTREAAMAVTVDGWYTRRLRPLFRKLRCITPMLGMSNGEVAWRTQGLRLFSGLGITVIPSVVAVNVERRCSSDFVIYC
jgi:hypothetical protein